MTIFNLKSVSYGFLFGVLIACSTGAYACKVKCNNTFPFCPQNNGKPSDGCTWNGTSWDGNKLVACSYMCNNGTGYDCGCE